MADKQDPKTENTETETESTEPETNDQEKAFWEKLAGVIDERLDAGVDRAVKKHLTRGKTEQGTKRTQGRTTLPGIVADFMGGPFARDK